jgi:hypothetical protein
MFRDDPEPYPWRHARSRQAGALHRWPGDTVAKMKCEVYKCGSDAHVPYTLIEPQLAAASTSAP